MLYHVQRYANEAATVVQDFYGSSYFILLWRKVAKFLHNFCARVSFHFILFYCKWANRFTESNFWQSGNLACKNADDT